MGKKRNLKYRKIRLIEDKAELFNIEKEEKEAHCKVLYK